jgi:hypothetical protein
MFILGRILMKTAFSLLIVFFIIFQHPAALAGHDRQPGLDRDTAAVDILSDILITRTMGLVGLIGGTAVFLVTLPVAAVTQSIDRTSQVFVKDPFEYTFKRKLGDLEEDKNY